MNRPTAHDGRDRLGTPASIVIPNWNGLDWIDPLLGSIADQTLPPKEVIVVDNGSDDGSPAHIRSRWPNVRVIELPSNRGFAAAVNIGVRESASELVALVNTDVVLDPDWLERAVTALERSPAAASVATKMVELDSPGTIYDAGDWLRRDGATEQRGRFRPDGGRFDSPGEAWSACAGAALYRTAAVLDAGGFDERFFTYLEDVELGLRLRLAGWDCVYEPCVARHAGGGSERALDGGAVRWVERNTILIVARHFPVAWLPMVLYRQLAWAFHNARAGTLLPWLRGLAAGLAATPAMLAERRAASTPRSAIDAAIPRRPWRGPQAGGHHRSPD